MDTNLLLSQRPAPPEYGTLQPFPCTICGKRFTRLENLRRHGAVHENRSQEPLKCPHCSTTFSRNDLRRRHIIKKHPEATTSPSGSQKGKRKKRSQTKVGDPTAPPPSSESPLTLTTYDFQSSSTSSNPFDVGTSEDFSNISVSRKPPWSPFELNTLVGEVDANDSDSSPQQFVIHQPNLLICPVQTTSLPDLPNLLGKDTLLSYLDLFFRHVDPVYPIIHRPSFDPDRAPPPLILAMLSVSGQYAENQEVGATLARQCFEAARNMLKKDSVWSAASIGHQDSVTVLSIIQAYLFLELHAIVFACGATTSIGLRMHARCIELARKGGLMEAYPTKSSKSEDLDQLWRQFIRAEMHKRTLYLIYHLDATWYLILSIPRMLSHLEIKHELPCPSQLWTASSSSQWAFLNLAPGGQAPLARYLVAVRSTMGHGTGTTPGSGVIGINASSVVNVDHIGALLVILFLQTSVREVSGWSTMTGRICSDRFEVLHNALHQMEMLATVHVNQKDVTPAALASSASWHMSMIELLLWSQPHTSGLVEGSLDAALAAATMLSSTRPLELTSEVIEILVPHVSWFLLYLVREDSNQSSVSPFVAVYAFKAALIAWQLTRTGMYDFANQLEIPELIRMEEWIRSVFGRGRWWGVGKLVLQSLDELEE